jgi:hypothetical protein
VDILHHERLTLERKRSRSWLSHVNNVDFVGGCFMHGHKCAWEEINDLQSVRKDKFILKLHPKFWDGGIKNQCYQILIHIKFEKKVEIEDQMAMRVVIWI